MRPRHVLFALMALAAIGVTLVTNSLSRPFQADANLRRIVVTVTDSNGNYITNVTAADFIIEIDGASYKIVEFARDVDRPVTFGLLLDTSSSMSHTLSGSREAAVTFVRGMRPDDESFLMTFAGRVQLKQDFTRRPSEMVEALQAIQLAQGTTNFLESVLKAADKAKKAANRKRALVVISDGYDKTEAMGLERFRGRIRGLELLVYPIQIVTPLQDIQSQKAMLEAYRMPTPQRSPETLSPTDAQRSSPSTAAERNRAAEAERRIADEKKALPPPRSPEESAIFAALRLERDKEAKARATALMESLASESGARHFVLNTENQPQVLLRELNRIFYEVAAELRGQYTIGFYPPPKAVARVRVRMTNPEYHVRTTQ
jgi:VWFA-related protein